MHQKRIKKGLKTAVYSKRPEDITLNVSFIKYVSGIQLKSYRLSILAQSVSVSFSLLFIPVLKKGRGGF